MKRIIVIVLIMCMTLPLAACKSKEQKAADAFLEELQTLLEDFEEDPDKWFNEAEFEDDLNELLEDYYDIYDDLEETDEGAAKEFEREVEALLDDPI